MRIRNRIFRPNLSATGGGGGGLPVPFDSLVHYWKMEEASGNARSDSVGSLSLVEAVDPVSRGTGIHNFAANVSDNRILTAEWTEPLSFSVSLWFKTEGSLTDPSEILFKNGINFSFDLLTSAGNGKVIWYLTDSLIPLEYSSGSDFGDWHLVVAGWTGSASFLSVDGGAVVSTLQSHTPANNTMAVYNGTSGVPVLVDEVGFYNRALGPSDIAILWNGGAGFFL